MYQEVLQTVRQQISNAIAQTSNAIVSTTGQLLQAAQNEVDQYLQTNNVSLSSSDRLLLIKALSNQRTQRTQSDSILSTSSNSIQLKQLYDVLDPKVSTIADTINQQKTIVQTALTSALLPPLVSGPTSSNSSSIPPTNTTQLYVSLDQLLSTQYNTLNQARQLLASSPSTTTLVTYREAEAKAASLIQQSIVNSQLAPIASLDPTIVYNNVLIQQPSISQILKANFSTLKSYLSAVVNTVNANSKPRLTNLWGLIPKAVSSLTTTTYKVALVQNSVRKTVSDISSTITAPIYGETAVIRAATTLTQTSFSTLDNAISAPSQILSNVQTAIAGRSQSIISFASTLSHGITSTISAINGLGKLPSQLIATLNPLFGTSADFANLFSPISNLLGMSSSVKPFDVSNYNVTAQSIQNILSSQEPGADSSIFGLDLNSDNSSPVSWAQSFAQNNLSLSTGSFMDSVNADFGF
jgi:predicted transcriptional regulator